MCRRSCLTTGTCLRCRCSQCQWRPRLQAICNLVKDAHQGVEMKQFCQYARSQLAWCASNDLTVLNIALVHGVHVVHSSYANQLDTPSLSGTQHLTRLLPGHLPSSCVPEPQSSCHSQVPRSLSHFAPMCSSSAGQGCLIASNQRTPLTHTMPTRTASESVATWQQSQSILNV